ncbi:MAG: glycoside hydrolase family 28 protein, partial [Armatimonadota bacterium]|nr:glycoside hydrolase family 28 protein [Armatimonadota bacterium]
MNKIILSLLFLLCAQSAQAQTTAPYPSIKPPVIPGRIFRITDYGAVGDGKTLNTRALQAILDACSAVGGGRVDVPPGRFLTGPLTLKSNLNLHLEKDATILLSGNEADYALTRGRYQQCIEAKDGHDIAITGSGTIDGQGGS